MNKQQRKELYTLLNHERVNLYGIKSDLYGIWMDEQDFCKANGIKSAWLKVTEYAYRAFESGTGVAARDLVEVICDEIDEIPSLYQKRARALIRIQAHNYINN